VAIPGTHTTANLLLQKLFPELTDRHPMLFSDIAPTVARGEVDAGVLIHEGRFTYREHGLKLIADLGVEWDRATGGLPLPLGAIVASRALPPGVVRDVEEMIRESIRYGFAHPGASREFIRSHAREMDDAVIDNHIALFVNDNSLTLSPEARLSIRTLTGLMDNRVSD
jgi:1,4-dihydroxy-6-naphthoate synthase